MGWDTDHRDARGCRQVGGKGRRWVGGKWRPPPDGGAATWPRATPTKTTSHT